MKNDLEQVQLRVGRHIANLRAAIELTQEQLAEGSGLDVRYVQRIEAGEINLTLESLVLLANVRRVAVESLFQKPSRHTAKLAAPSMRNSRWGGKK